MHNFPILTRQNLSPTARLFADRLDLMESLVPQIKGGVIAEVGVALGDFSAFLIEKINPATFVAFDIFEIHQQTMLWGRETSSIFEGGTHLDYYRKRMAQYPAKVVIEHGSSHDKLRQYPAQSFDMIYIDAAHTYAEVKIDAENAVRAIKDNGYIVFNDYIMYDHVLNAPYGVVPVVNELLTSFPEWKITGFGLQKDLFCDIVISKRPS